MTEIGKKNTMDVIIGDPIMKHRHGKMEELLTVGNNWPACSDWRVNEEFPKKY